MVSTISKVNKNTAEQMVPVIQKTPGVIGGDACIRNTRISVWLLVQLRDELGMSDADIKNYFDPPLSDADLSAAWSYFKNNKREIDEAILRNEAE
jgi:uncharacterized protein (DUF433 family)